MDEIYMLKELLRDADAEYLREWCDNEEEPEKGFYDYLADFLLENGVIVLPCKVGQHVWIVYTPKWPADPADKGKWFMKEDGVQRILFGSKGFSVETWNMGTYPEKKLGETVFLSKEEAEAKLQEKSK